MIGSGLDMEGFIVINGILCALAPHIHCGMYYLLGRSC